MSVTYPEEIGKQNATSPIQLHNMIPQITFPAKLAGKFFFDFLYVYHYNDMFCMTLGYTMYVR